MNICFRRRYERRRENKKQKTREFITTAAVLQSIRTEGTLALFMIHITRNRLAHFRADD